jgi:hypothetical protein
MAKKRAKKATRRASKAKASQARRRDRVPVDRATGQGWIFDPKTGELTREALPGVPRKLTPRQRAILEEREQSRRIRREEILARRKARYAMRPPAMRSRDFALPQDLQDWLLSLFSTAKIDRFFWQHSFSAGEADSREVEANCYELRNLAIECYLEGCRQGYIEGYVHRRQSDIKRSRAGNDGKRQAPVKVRDEIMSRDERDERMAADYATLCEIMKPTAACMELASRYGFESWQGVRKALKNHAARGLQ